MSQHDFSARSNPTRKLLAAAVFLALSTGTAAAASAIHVDIPAQPLSASLRALATQGGAQVVFTSDAVSNKAGVAISGDMSLDEALQRLLAGTGLAFRKEGENSYVVVPATEKGAALDEVVVTATRTERNIRDVPASVSVITADNISTQQAQKVEDLLRNVEGVDVKSEGGIGVGTVMLRGVSESFAGKTTQVLVDGMTAEPQALAPKGAGYEFTSLNEIERIEVVRGPASSLYGPGAIGGVINIIPKKWAGSPGAEVTVGRGSHNTRAVGAAAGGAWDKVDVRVSANDVRSDGYIAEREPYGSLSQDLEGRDWRDRKYGFQFSAYPTNHQQVTLDIRDYDQDTAWVGGRPNYRVAREGSLVKVGYKVEFENNNDLKLTYLHASVKERLNFDGLVVGGFPNDFIEYDVEQRNETADSFEVQSNIRVGSGNSLTLGMSYSTGKQDETVDWSVPQTTPVGIDWAYGADYFEHDEYKWQTTAYGVYAQDEIRVRDDTILTVGARYDRFKLHDNTTDTWDNINGPSSRQDPDSTDGVFNPRLGVRYKPAAGTSLYASYGTAYLPARSDLRYRSNAVRNNPDLKAEHSASFEVGMNQDWSRASGRMALYRTDYKDKIESRQDMTSAQYVNISRVEVEGLELAIEGRGDSTWRPYLNYTYTDSIIASNPGVPDSEGKRLKLVAKHKFNFGTIYAPWPDTTIRLSGRYVGDRYYDITNADGSRAPGYFVADFKIAQRFAFGASARNVEISLAVNNLFDKDYIEQKLYGTVENSRTYADGRNIWCGVTGRF